jgi:hypothetical protein
MIIYGFQISDLDDIWSTTSERLTAYEPISALPENIKEQIDNNNAII